MIVLVNLSLPEFYPHYGPNLDNGFGLRIWEYGSGVTDLGLLIWITDLDYGSGLRVRIMDLDYGSGLWIWITDLVYGSGLRIWITDPDCRLCNTDWNNFGHDR